MAFVIQRRKMRSVKDDRAIIGLPYHEQVEEYARYLERLLKRRGVKYPAQRFRPRGFTI